MTRPCRGYGGVMVSTGMVQYRKRVAVGRRFKKLQFKFKR